MTPDWRDAAASAVDASVRRAKTCPDCGMLAGSGLGPHYLGCSREGEPTSAPAAPSATYRAERRDHDHDDGAWDANGWERLPTWERRGKR